MNILSTVERVKDMHKKPSLEYQAFACFAIIIGMGSWSSILYPWMPKVMSYLSSFQAYILLFSLWAIAVVGVSFFTYRSISCRKALRGRFFSKEMSSTWFMVPMLCMCVHLIGNAFLERALTLNMNWIGIVLGINTLLLIVGLLWFHCLSAVVVVRIAQQVLTFAEINYFLVFLLGTVGLTIWIILDTATNLLLMGLLDATQHLKLLASFFGGFGIWIVVFIFIHWCYQIWMQRRSIRMEWGLLIFSFHVYTIASHKIAEEFLSPLTSGVSNFLTLFLTILWLSFWKSRVVSFIHPLEYEGIKEKRSRV